MDFKQEVVEKSKETPILVDFWAPWCGPCQFLTPQLEELAAEANGRWQLVKVNTDQHPDISQQYKISGIPAIKLFVNGAVKAEFTGAQPKHYIENWLEEHLPDARKEALATIQQQLWGGEHQAATEALEALVASHPLFAPAKALLAATVVFQDIDRAATLVAEAKTDMKVYQQATAVNDVIEFFTTALPEKENLANLIIETRQHLQKHDFGPAIEHLIKAIMLNKQWANELSRRVCVAIFALMGANHPLTKQCRRRFDMALY